jgi:5'-3' exonuclease
MDVHLIDGTYELFRHFFAMPAAADVNGQEIGAVRGVLTSVLSMIERGATHVGVATDHVVESFRNDLYAGYKTSEGVPPELLSQFPVLEETLEAMGVMVWPMVFHEADDALASVHQTKISVSVLWAHESFNWTAGAISYAMKPVLWPSSE